MLNNCPTVHPNKIWTDRGRDFEGEFHRFCKRVGIHQNKSFSGTKAAFAGRTIRTLESQIVRYLKEELMWRNIDKLPDFVKTLNNRVNRSIGRALSKVEKKHVLKFITLEQSFAVMKEKKPSTKKAERSHT